MATTPTEARGKEIQRYNPKDGAAEVHLTDAATKMAERAKDITAFKNAITKNLNAKHDFAAHYKATFKNGTLASTGQAVEDEVRGRTTFSYVPTDRIKSTVNILVPEKFVLGAPSYRRHVLTREATR